MVHAGLVVLARMSGERDFIKRIHNQLSNFVFLKQCIQDCLEKLEKKDCLNSSLKLGLKDFLYNDGSIIISNRNIMVGTDILGRVRKKLYSPKPDLAFAPFNLRIKTAGQTMFNLCKCIEDNCSLIVSFIDGLKKYYSNNVKEYRDELKEYASYTNIELPAKIIDKLVRVNKNPRSFIAVEVCFSGSMKHTLDSLVNASILGYYGILVTNTRMLLKALRLKYYLSSMTELKEIKSTIGKNVFIITDEQLEQLLENLKITK